MIVHGQEVVEWVAARTNDYGNYGAAQGIGVVRDGQLIGGVALNEYNGANINMHTAASVSNWLSREYLFCIFDYCFRQLGVNRVTGLVGEGNTHARRFNEKVGLVEETRCKRAHPTGDLIVYVMWPENCKWLKWNRSTSRPSA